MNLGGDANRLAAEARARVLIDRQLGKAGWWVQDKQATNLFASQGVVVREVTLKPGHGRVDYVVYVDQAAVGVIEAKPEGTPLSGVEWQSAMYAEGLPPDVNLAALTKDGRLPFVFEASGTETHFTNGFDPEPRARRIFHFPQPATLAGVLKRKDDEHPTWRGKVGTLPPLDEKPLRPAQIEAINGVERNLAEQRYDRSLVQMATGAGKTYTAVTLSYRLLKHGGFDRILFLVDRNTLAKQTMAEFENYQTADDGRKFTELYNVNRLRRGPMPDATSVAISVRRIALLPRSRVSRWSGSLDWRHDPLGSGIRIGATEKTAYLDRYCDPRVKARVWRIGGIVEENTSVLHQADRDIDLSRWSTSFDLIGTDLG